MENVVEACQRQQTGNKIIFIAGRAQNGQLYFGKPSGNPTADAAGLLRRDLAGDEGLPEMIDAHPAGERGTDSGDIITHGFNADRRFGKAAILGFRYHSRWTTWQAVLQNIAIIILTYCLNFVIIFSG